MVVLVLIAKRLFVCMVLECSGILILKFSNQLVLSLGTTDVAETYLPGGTVTLWKLIGIACTIGGLLVLFGYAKTLGL